MAANFLAIESRARENPSVGRPGHLPAPPRGEDLRLSYKKVVLVDNDKPLPTLGFLI